MFWILNSENFASKLSFCTIRAYLCKAKRELSLDFAPITTILPGAKMRAVVFGSQIHMITAVKRSKTCEWREGWIQCSSRAANGLEVKAAVKVDHGDNALEGGDNPLGGNDV
jgi:hypothetical protein